MKSWECCVFCAWVCLFLGDWVFFVMSQLCVSVQKMVDFCLLTHSSSWQLRTNGTLFGHFVQPKSHKRSTLGNNQLFRIYFPCFVRRKLKLPTSSLVSSQSLSFTVIPWGSLALHAWVEAQRGNAPAHLPLQNSTKDGSFGALFWQGPSDHLPDAASNWGWHWLKRVNIIPVLCENLVHVSREARSEWKRWMMN